MSSGTHGTRLCLAAACVALATALALPVGALAAEGGVTMYRLYNKYSGEHFYTSSAYERDTLTRVGWNDEGVGWIAPASGEAVYRLYNPYAPGGDHHYTTSAIERDALVSVGWSYEGVGWYSGGSVKVYRQYNPYAVTGTHNYTTSENENNELVQLGWHGEGVGWYAVEADHDWTPLTTTVHHDAQYKTVHHDAVVEYRNICNGCGADITGNEAAHAEEAMLNGNAACGAWHTEPVTVQAAYDEQVLVSAAWDETVTTGYKCSTCGATKQQ